MTTHAIASADTLDVDGISCLECGVTVENDECAITGPDAAWTITALDLLPHCEGVSETDAHHFEPIAGGIACRWCQGQITLDGADITAECIRPE